MISRIFLIFDFVIFVFIFTASDARPPASIYQLPDAAPGEFPYMVSLRKHNIHICGGAIISSRHILTAAHCFVDPPYNDGLIVITGATKNRALGQVHKVDKVTRHCKFMRDKQNGWNHDIAVVTLSDKMIFNQYQNSIALPSTHVSGNIVASLAGWGNISSNGSRSEWLKETKVAVLTNKECNEKYTSPIRKTQMCGCNGKGIGFCHGDSGSPLTYKNEVIGVVSYSASCKILYPDNYTRVSKYVNFVSRVIATT